jgi:WD40 repeat protein
MTVQQIAFRPLHTWISEHVVVRVACSTNGKRIAIGSETGPIEFWEQREEQWFHVYSYSSHANGLPLFELSADGVKFAVAHPDIREIGVYVTCK